jgi:hypothetical protein
MTTPHSDQALGEHAVQILSTEHWSLLSSRSLAYIESFSRVTVFLTVLSAAIVALALVANTTGVGTEFTWAAGLLAPLVLFLGITTYVRLVQLNLDDLFTVLAMNRLRHAYLEIEPGLRPYLTAGWHDDERGVVKSLLLVRSATPNVRWHALITTPTVIALIVAFVAAAWVGLLVTRWGGSAAVAALASVFVMILGSALLFVLQIRSLAEARRVIPRFPSSPEDYADELGP